MTALNLIVVFASLWLFLVLIMVIAAYRANKRTLKKIKDAHQAEQTTLLDDVDICWEELGFECGEPPFIHLH
jgi:hypothetical protein